MQRLSARERRWGDWARYARTTRCAGAKPNANCRARGASVAEAIERFDAFEAAMDTLRGALECVDIKTGELHRPEHVQALIEGVAQRIESLGVGECAKLAEVPAQPGAGVGAGPEERVAPARGVGRALVGAGGELGVPVLVLGQGAAQAPCPRAAPRAVSTSSWRLRGTARPAWPRERIAARCYRGGAAPAPSRLECHRGVQCGTTPLSLRPQGRHSGLSRPVRAWFNLRTRRWGRHKGTSAHECLTGQRVHDWLTLLGCPPSPTLH